MGLETQVVDAVPAGSVAWVARQGEPWDQLTQGQEQEQQGEVRATHLHSVFPLSRH